MGLRMGVRDPDQYGRGCGCNSGTEPEWGPSFSVHFRFAELGSPGGEACRFVAEQGSRCGERGERAPGLPTEWAWVRGGNGRGACASTTSAELAYRVWDGRKLHSA